MKRKIIGVLAASAIMLCTASCATASTGTVSSSATPSTASSALGALGNILEGVFTTSKLEVSDLAGEWTAEGSAVSFLSENFLQKAGGTAAAGIVESKLDPYYKQYGLMGAVMTIQPDGTFTLKSSKITMNGTITKGTDGNFIFNFNVLGLQNLGKFKTYVEKSPANMNVMFDATKLRTLLEFAAKLSGSKLAGTASSVLGSYDGICVGFKMKKTGSVEGEKKGVVESITNALGIGKSTQTTTKDEKEPETKSTTQSALETLGNILRR